MFLMAVSSPGMPLLDQYRYESPAREGTCHNDFVPDASTFSRKAEPTVGHDGGEQADNATSAHSYHYTATIC